MTEVFPHQQPRDPSLASQEELCFLMCHIFLSIHSRCLSVCVRVNMHICLLVCLSLHPTSVCACMYSLRVWGGAYTHVCSYIERQEVSFGGVLLSG